MRQESDETRPVVFLSRYRSGHLLYWVAVTVAIAAFCISFVV